MADPDVLLDRYELGELIGAGGSARVHRAHDRRLDRRVAVKILDTGVARSADPANHQRFVREARSSARFSHPHAVATYDAGEADGRLFIVMEFVDGGSLADRIAADAPIADRHVARVGTQLLSALAAAHAAGIVHRDVKPANVLLTRDGTVKLADFGIARRFDEITTALTVEGMVMGTRAYLAPEQARGDEVGPAADLYAVGATLYEMATGERAPTTSADAERGADPSAVVAGVSPAIAATIATALAGRPERRFADAAAMSSALTAPPSTAAYPASPVAPATATMPATTAAMPAAARPVGAAATTAMPQGSAPSGAPAPTRQRRRGWWFVAVMALLGLGAGVTALALANADDDAPGDLAATTTPAAASSTAPPAETTTAPSSTAPAATTTPSTSPPTTVPPTTVPPTTVPPTTVPPTTLDELIPGFPDTDDIDQFIEQLRDSDRVAGKQSKKLGDRLRDLQREDDDLDEEIADLVDEIDEWLDDEEIDPTVAERALEFVDELERDE